MGSASPRALEVRKQIHPIERRAVPRTAGSRVLHQCRDRRGKIHAADQLGKDTNCRNPSLPTPDHRDLNAQFPKLELMAAERMIASRMPCVFGSIVTTTSLIIEKVDQRLGR